MKKFTAFYRKNMFENITRTLENDYVPFMTVDAKGLEDAFMKLQGEVISPNGELRNAVIELGLSHTSMSVGDILYSHEDDKYWIVNPIGFMPVLSTISR